MWFSFQRLLPTMPDLGEGECMPYSYASLHAIARNFILRQRPFRERDFSRSIAARHVDRNSLFIGFYFVIDFGDKAVFARWRVTLRRRIVGSSQVRGQNIVQRFALVDQLLCL
jgi:hypothetical protein